MKLKEIFTKEKELKMIWRLKKEAKASYLIGASHFFKCSFRNSLRMYISKLDTVLLEGPLDDVSMKRVADFGQKAEGFPSLYDSLDNDTINKIAKETGYHLHGMMSSFVRYHDLFVTKESTDQDMLQIKGLRPWMAFFKIWFQYLEKNGWKCKMDVDAFNIAKELDKNVYFLETIEEQIDALNAIPFERIVNYLKKIEIWQKYRKLYVKNFLKGDIENIMSLAEMFPTRCESIIDKRDPILFERMTPFLEKGNAFIMVGVTHIPGIMKMLLQDGYDASQIKKPVLECISRG